MTRILCIEDDVPFATSLARQLEAHGYTVDIASTGTAGLWQAENDPPDLILCDLGLPGRDGHSVVAVLHLVDATRAIPVIIVTGQDRASVLAELTVPVAGVFTKPVDIEQLVSCIRGILDDPQPVPDATQPG